MTYTYTKKQAKYNLRKWICSKITSEFFRVDDIGEDYTSITFDSEHGYIVKLKLPIEIVDELEFDYKYD